MIQIRISFIAFLAILATAVVIAATRPVFGHSSAPYPTLKKGEKTIAVARPANRQTPNDPKPNLQSRPYLHPRVAIIIDDVGLVSPKNKWAAEFLKIPAPLTWSVLPFRPFTHLCAGTGVEHGFPIMLHLPVDPFNGRKKPGIGFIIKGSTKEQAIQQFEADLAQVPEARGVNNHMGNLGTHDDIITAAVMGQVKKHNLFFVDSLTGPYSIIGRYARIYQVPFADRDVFIDDKSALSYKVGMLHHLIKIAQKYGEGVAIGHVRAGTAKAILRVLPEMKRAGIEIVPVATMTKILPQVKSLK